MSARTSIVTVAYNSAAVLAGMLASVPADTPVVVVDNASSDGSGDIAAAAGARIVRLEENEGFGRGCNAGAAQCDTEFLFFVNPDAVIGEGAIDALEQAADAYPDSSAFNPHIKAPDGGYQLKRRSLIVPKSQWISREIPEDGSPLPSLLGGALFCRRKAFDAIGGFDDEIFLYHEDDDLAARLAAKCGPLRFAAKAVVTHNAGHSSGRSPAVARFKGYHMARSKVHVLRKHGYSIPLARTLVSALGGFLLPHNLFSARRRAKYAGLISGSLSAFSDGGAYAGPGNGGGR